MFGRIGTTLIFSTRQFRSRSLSLSALVFTVTASSLASRTTTHPSLCQNQFEYSRAFGSNDDNSGSLFLPTLEAAARAFRLVYTVASIVMDYEIAKYKPKTNMLTSVPDEEEDLEALQAAMEAKERILEDAQVAYSTKIQDVTLSTEERKAIKEQQKSQMKKAAEELANIEEQITSKVGESSKAKLHREAARRLLDLCRVNGGVYIKVGQHLANLDYLIPQEYINVLSSLFDDTPRSSYSDVCAVIEEELGEKVEDLFDDFDTEPIASASLAQVHVAFDKKTGKKLAVKVQHRGLRETARGDLFAVTKIVGIIDRWFEDFTFGWIADEIAPHLPKELDFTREAKNSEKAAEDILKTGLPCIVPKVVWSRTAPRVLTMEFEEGFKATDQAAIRESGLSKHDIAKLISSVFNSQVFLSAWVHCDPHPANVLIRRGKHGSVEMVLVDHGLYKAIDHNFRIRYARLWRSLMLADLQEIKSSCHAMGVDQAYPLFAAMLTARPYDEIIERSKTGAFTAAEASPDSSADRAVIRGYAKQFMKDIFLLLGTLPPQILLLLKMNDCLRHIDFALGSPANSLVIAGKYAARAVFEDEMTNPSMATRFASWIKYLNVLLRIQIYDCSIMVRHVLHGSDF